MFTPHELEVSGGFYIVDPNNPYDTDDLEPNEIPENVGLYYEPLQPLPDNTFERIRSNLNPNNKYIEHVLHESDLNYYIVHNPNAESPIYIVRGIIQESLMNPNFYNLIAMNRSHRLYINAFINTNDIERKFGPFYLVENNHEVHEDDPELYIVPNIIPIEYDYIHLNRINESYPEAVEEPAQDIDETPLPSAPAVDRLAQLRAETLRQLQEAGLSDDSDEEKELSEEEEAKTDIKEESNGEVFGKRVY